MIPLLLRFQLTARYASLVIGTLDFRTPEGNRFLVEVGALAAPIRAILDRLRSQLLIGLPIAVVAAAGGVCHLVSSENREYRRQEANPLVCGICDTFGIVILLFRRASKGAKITHAAFANSAHSVHLPKSFLPRSVSRMRVRPQ
jgi:hypothetical protein